MFSEHKLDFMLKEITFIKSFISACVPVRVHIVKDYYIINF